MPVILPEEHHETWLSGEAGKEVLVLVLEFILTRVRWVLAAQSPDLSYMSSYGGDPKTVRQVAEADHNGNICPALRSGSR
jgi:hypothetical protein